MQMLTLSLSEWQAFYVNLFQNTHPFLSKYSFNAFFFISSIKQNNIFRNAASMTTAECEVLYYIRVNKIVNCMYEAALFRKLCAVQ